MCQSNQSTMLLSGNDFGRDTPNSTAEMIELLLADYCCWHFCMDRPCGASRI